MSRWNGVVNLLVYNWKTSVIVGIGRSDLTLPWCLIDVEARERNFKVARIGQTVTTQRPKLGELIVRAEYFLYVCRSSEST